MPKYMVRVSDVTVLETNSKLRAVLEMAKEYITSEWFDVMHLIQDGHEVLIEVNGRLKK